MLLSAVGGRPRDHPPSGAGPEFVVPRPWPDQQLLQEAYFRAR